MPVISARASIWLVALTALIVNAGCSSNQKIENLKVANRSPGQGPTFCRTEIPRSIPDAIEALTLFSELVEASCHSQALALGQAIQATYREKSYSVSSEIFSVFLPEDTLAEYVLESFERAYLSFLMARTYLALGRSEAAAVELRKSYAEGRAQLYNYGDDPVNMILIAALWENFGELESARPFWKRATETLPVDDPVASFSMARVQSIDAGEKSGAKKRWRILTLGRFPKLDWNIGFGRGENGYYRLSTVNHTWPAHCHSKETVVVSSRTWLAKLGARYSSDYHPLLNVKSWVRLPIGVAYGMTTFAVGLGVAFGGCAAAVSAEDRSGFLCEGSLKAGFFLMSKSGEVTSYALKPDLRHWDRVPAGFMITSQDVLEADACWQALPEPAQVVKFDLVP